MTTTTLNPQNQLASARPSIGRRIWLALEAYGQRRAAAELRLIGMQRANSDPALSHRMFELSRKL